MRASVDKKISITTADYHLNREACGTKQWKVHDTLRIRAVGEDFLNQIR